MLIKLKILILIVEKSSHQLLEIHRDKNRDNHYQELAEVKTTLLNSDGSWWKTFTLEFKKNALYFSLVIYIN